MLFRNCAGGVVFSENKVLIIKNDKGEWTLPKGAVRHDNTADEVAITRVKNETGIDAKMICSAGETSYEFFSYSRQKPVCNVITWFVMKAEEDNITLDVEQGFLDAGFYEIDKALDILTHNQEKSLIRISHQKYKDLCKIGA